MDIRLNINRILIFLAFVLGAAWVVALVVNGSGLKESSPMTALTLANYIIITLPALGNIFTRLVTKEGWGHLWLRPNFGRTASVRGGWRFYLAAWLLPVLAVIVGGGAFYLLYPQSFDPSLGEVQKLFAMSPALAANPWLGLSILFVQIMLVSLVINGIASIGEEFGWRAYLLQKLMAQFAGRDPSGPAHPNTGARRAALLVGLVWGVWHYPLFYISGSLTLPFALLYLVFTCSLSVLLSWVTLRSGSVWPASIGHGMINAASALPMFLLKGPAIPLVGPDSTGLVGMLGFLALALVLLLNRRAFAGQTAEGRGGSRTAQPLQTGPG